ncbi:MAG: hypothetical protein ABS69_11580 [Nitrosomonadales bacterium SCN 54-20]|nr:MAG: hypothetical protein ABS69_11580 [Nitrosomonadales bacterium SCN 54-20]
MPKASTRASAHKFLVVSSLPYASFYTGTREQLIALGVAHPDQFPEGRKRLKWDYSMENSNEEGWEVKKLKSDRFELKKHHKYVAPKATPIPFRKISIIHCPEEKTDKFMPYKYEVCGNEELDESTWEALFAASEEIIKVMEQFNARFKRNASRLQLVKSSSAMLSAALSVAQEVQHD